MTFSRTGLLAATLLSLVLAGCQSQRFTPMETRQPAPAPLQGAPAGQVTSGQLPPPGQPGSATDLSAGDMSQFPTAPGQEGDDMDGGFGQNGGQQVAALPSDGPAVSAGSVAGVWNASVSGQSCRIATPQTRFGEGYRAGPLRCPSPLDGVRSWNVSGNQLALYDDSGNVLARLSSSGGERFEGQTTSGSAVSMSR